MKILLIGNIPQVSLKPVKAGDADKVTHYDVTIKCPVVTRDQVQLLTGDINGQLVNTLWDSDDNPQRFIDKAKTEFFYDECKVRLGLNNEFHACSVRCNTDLIPKPEGILSLGINLRIPFMKNVIGILAGLMEQPELELEIKSAQDVLFLSDINAQAAAEKERIAQEKKANKKKKNATARENDTDTEDMFDAGPEDAKRAVEQGKGTADDPGSVQSPVPLTDKWIDRLVQFTTDGKLDQGKRLLKTPTWVEFKKTLRENLNDIYLDDELMTYSIESGQYTIAMGVNLDFDLKDVPQNVPIEIIYIKDPEGNLIDRWEGISKSKDLLNHLISSWTYAHKVIEQDADAYIEHKHFFRDLDDNLPEDIFLPVDASALHNAQSKMNVEFLNDHVVKKGFFTVDDQSWLAVDYSLSPEYETVIAFPVWKLDDSKVPIQSRLPIDLCIEEIDKGQRRKGALYGAIIEYRKTKYIIIGDQSILTLREETKAAADG